VSSTKDPPAINNASINGVPAQPKQKKKITTATTKIAQSKTNLQLKVSPNITFKVR